MLRTKQGYKDFFSLPPLRLLALRLGEGREDGVKRGRWFQNDLNIFYLLQLIVKTYQNSFSIFYAKINRKMIGYFDSKVVLEVAVGTALAGRPPHRSGREELPHPAPTSGSNAEALIAASRTRSRSLDKSSGST